MSFDREPYKETIKQEPCPKDPDMKGSLQPEVPQGCLYVSFIFPTWPPVQFDSIVSFWVNVKPWQIAKYTFQAGNQGSTQQGILIMSPPLNHSSFPSPSSLSETHTHTHPGTHTLAQNNAVVRIGRSNP